MIDKITVQVDTVEYELNKPTAAKQNQVQKILDVDFLQDFEKHKTDNAFAQFLTRNILSDETQSQLAKIVMASEEGIKLAETFTQIEWAVVLTRFFTGATVFRLKGTNGQVHLEASSSIPKEVNPSPGVIP